MILMFAVLLYCSICIAVRTCFLFRPPHHCLKLTPKRFHTGELVPNLDDPFQTSIQRVDLCKDALKTLNVVREMCSYMEGRAYVANLSYECGSSHLEFGRLMLSSAIR